MKLEYMSPLKKTKKSKKCNAAKVDKRNDSFAELTEWLNQNSMPKKKLTYSEQQICELKDFIQITAGIKLSKKTIEDKLIFRCKKFKQCGYQIQFKMSSTQKISKNPPQFTVAFCPKGHNVKNNNGCFFHEGQVIVAARKKYLNLIRPLIKFILVSSQQNSHVKNPTWLMKQLESIKNQTPDYIFKDLDGNCKRQVKKAFDNLVLKTKNQIKSETIVPLPKKKRITKTKKTRKVPNDKIKKEHKPDGLYFEDFCSNSKQVKQQIVEIQMIQEQEVEQKSMNAYEKCFNEVRMEEDLFNEKNFRPKPQSYMFQTPTKKKERFGFDLQKSGSKRRTTYNKSYQESYLFDSVEKIKPFKSDSDSSERA